MIFSHDTERSLQVVVDLVNTDAACCGAEGLPDAQAVQAFVEAHHVSGVDPADYARVAPLWEVRQRFRGLFGVSSADTIARRVNELVAEAPMSPRLSDHDGYGWHLHYFAPNASLADHLAVDGGMAIGQVVAAEETERLRLCAAPDCQAVLVDLSRNRSKRYCDARSCGNRLNVAAYRERKRAATSSSV